MALPTNRLRLPLFQSQRMQIGGFLAFLAELFGYFPPFFRRLRQGVGGGGFAFHGCLDGFIQRGEILFPAGQAKIEPRFAIRASWRSISAYWAAADGASSFSVQSCGFSRCDFRKSVVAALTGQICRLFCPSESQTSRANAASRAGDLAFTTPIRPAIPKRKQTAIPLPAGLPNVVRSRYTLAASREVRRIRPRIPRSFRPIFRSRPLCEASSLAAGRRFSSFFCSLAVGQVIAMPHCPAQNARRTAAGSHFSDSAALVFAASTSSVSASTIGGSAINGSIVWASNQVE